MCHAQKRIACRTSMLLLVSGLLCLFEIQGCKASEPKDPSKQVPAGSEAQGKKQQSEKPRVIMKTSLGDIVLELDRTRAPITVENFLQYAADGFYDGTVFHRVIAGFMIQGGGMEPGLKRKETRNPIRNEAANGLKNQTGTIAMARTSVVDSATSQFFINCKDNSFLDHRGASPQGYGYAVFGRVVEGMDVVRKIEKAPTGASGPYRDVPKEDVLILSVRIQTQ